MNVDPAAHAGTLLLLFARRPAWSVEEVARTTQLPMEDVRAALQRLETTGFVDVHLADDTAYRLNARGDRGSATMRRILIVEDSDTIRRLVSLVLLDGGYAVIAAGSPSDAVELLRAAEFDLVITDSFEPVAREGFPSTAEMRVAAGSTPVALLSAHRVTPREIESAGFRTSFPKPFDIELLEQLVDQLLGGEEETSR